MKNVDTIRERERESGNLRNEKISIYKCFINNVRKRTGYSLFFCCKK